MADVSCVEGMDEVFLRVCVACGVSKSLENIGKLVKYEMKGRIG